MVLRRRPSSRSRCRRRACPGSLPPQQLPARCHSPANLLLRRPSHNHCCSDSHRTTAAPAAIIPLSASSSISAFIPTPRHEAATGSTDYSTCDLVTRSFNATVSFKLGWRTPFLWALTLRTRPTESSRISVGEENRTDSQKNVVRWGWIYVFGGPKRCIYKDLDTENCLFFFFFCTVVSANRNGPKNMELLDNFSYYIAAFSTPNRSATFSPFLW